MSNTNTQSLSFNSLEQGKDKNLRTQKSTIFHFLEQNTATASMVSVATGIPQKSICRYKRDLETNGLLFEIEKKLCEKTGFRAWYLTTNTGLFPQSNQLKMF